jgi:hypothetical protein
MRHGVRALVLVSILVSPVFWPGIGAPSPDGMLYEGLARLLFELGIYEDHVRDDEILPTIGHPALIGVLRGLGPSGLFAVSLAAFGGLLALVAPRNAYWFLTTALAAILFADGMAKSFNAWGVESSIILSTALVCSMVVLYIRSPGKLSLSLLSLAWATAILIRPVLMPLTPFAVIGAFLLGRHHGLRGGLWFGLVGALLWVAVLSVSIVSHGDARMTGGTYSAIPLYAAFNEHIDLKRNYHSGLWRGLDYSAAIFENKGGWAERDARLKGAVIDFIITEPTAALEGVSFRLGRYLWDAESSGNMWVGGKAGYPIALMLAAGLVIFAIGTAAPRREPLNRTFLSAGVMLVLFLYLAVVNSAFVYVSPRYVVANFVTLCFFIAAVSTALERQVRIKA